MAAAAAALCTTCSERPRAYSGHSYCRPCYSDYQRTQRERHRDKRRAYDRERPRRRPNPERDRNSSLMRNFGITSAEYDEMLREQAGVCAVCSRPEKRAREGVVMALAVDHCHDTGKVRGLLCNDCNLAIGKFRDDPVCLRAAADYIEATR